MNQVPLSQLLANQYYDACIAELQAIKPGNVHIFADGHQMDVADFIHSAEVSSVLMGNPTFTVGERILASVKATHARVGCNTNLGIILLLAPVMNAIFRFHAVQTNHMGAEATMACTNIKHDDLALHLKHVLAELTVDDAKQAAEAIQLANPAGLGQVQEHDVHAPIEASLYTLMQASQDRDMIAYQYCHGFNTIFHDGLSLYQEALTQFQNPAWATTGLYLSLLARYADSHIARKHGLAMAHRIQKEAQTHCDAFWQTSNPKLAFSALLQWDAALKERHINPGTSADMTVATLFMDKILAGD